MPYFACTLMLERGSVIRPGNWGRMVRAIGSGHPEWQREVILEEVRKVEFPNAPSRLECAFVIDDLPEAQYYVSKASAISLGYQVNRHDLKAAIESALAWCDQELTEIEAQIIL